MIVLGFFFFQAEDGIRDLVRSRGLGDVYKRQRLVCGDATFFYLFPRCILLAELKQVILQTQ